MHTTPTSLQRFKTYSPWQEFEICNYVYKHRSLLANDNNHCHDTRRKFLLAPKAHYTYAYYQKNLQYMGCRIFNKLPVEVQNSPNFFIFKKSVKFLLLEKNDISEFF